MGIQDLQALYEAEGVSVDLFRIGRNHAGGFRLVLDAEGCLDRLYGGFFSDWACGGQWARCAQFLSTLSSALAEHQVTLCVCFSGAHPAPSATPSPPAHWLQQQALYRQRVNNVLRHVQAKGTPPPKVWWVPPAGLQSCLRAALHQMNVPVMVSSDDHHQEVVGLCRERGYAGIIANSGEYLAFQPPRYFSSSQMKLTYRSSLETKEYMVHDLAQWLEVPQERLCVLAALLGNTVLTEHHLTEFHKRISNNQKKLAGDDLVRAVAEYVRGLQSNDLDTITTDIFGNPNDNRSARFKQSVQYYVNGTKDGFLKYKTATARRPKSNKKVNNTVNLPKENDMDTSRLASESAELGEKSLDDYKPSEWLTDSLNDVFEKKGNKNLSTGSSTSGAASKSNNMVLPSVAVEVLRTCAERHSKGLMSPALLAVLQHRQLTLPTLLEDEAHRELPDMHRLFRPVRQYVYAILFNMHHHRFMANRAKDGEKPPVLDVSVSEWIYSRQNPGKTPDIVPGIMLDWPVPTVQRLWFGTAQDDRRRRLRAFLSCMRSDTALILNTSYVPHHLLILATVLRYIMTAAPCLRRHELDAFLATAFATDLRSPLHLQGMTLQSVNVRGIQLGTLLMAGVETALLANDACGAPVPLIGSSPWTFFDGKLFQHKLARANSVKHLVQLCDNQVEVVLKVERMRKAILEGLDVEFAMPPLPLNPNVQLGMGYPPPGVLGWSGGRGGAPGGLARGGARLKIAGVVVGQWGANYARSSNSRYPVDQVKYVGYPAAPRGTYGYMGGRGRGRGGAAGRGGALTARAARRPRTTRPTTMRQTTVSLNGKSVKADDTKISSNGTDSSSNEAQVDSTTDGTQVQEGNSDTQESDGVGDGGVVASVQSAAKGQGKTAKNVKKNATKGKKKSNQKTDSPAKCEELKINDNNGTFSEKNSLSGINKLTGKPGAAMVNGGNGASSNGDHKGQGDSPLND